MKNHIKANKWQLGLAVLLIISASFNVIPHEIASGAGLAMMMGSTTINQAFVQQFDTTMRLLAQQKESRLESTIMDKGNIVGESFTANLLAALEDTPENNVRHGDTVFSDATHSVRVALMRDFHQALPVDRNDLPKLLANPNGPYMDSLIAAWNRRKDGIIFNALIGNSQTKEGSLIALPSGQIIVNGATGFTKAKAIAAKKIFRKNESDEHVGDELFIAFNSEMLEDVLSDTTLTSADYMAVKMLQEGDISGKWLGFKWVPYERLTLSGGVYSTAVWAKSAAWRGTGFVEGKVSQRPDKKDLTQTSMAGSYGAVRVEEAKVVRVDFT